MPRDSASALDAPLEFAREVATKAAVAPTAEREQPREMHIRGDDTGWASVVILEGQRQERVVPSLVLVRRESLGGAVPPKTKKKFEIVRVLERTRYSFGKKVAVLWNDDQSPLQAVEPRLAGAVLTMNIATRELSYTHGGREYTLEAFTDVHPEKIHGALPKSPPGRPWKIQIPDEKHELGDPYGPLGSVWFKIETDATDVRSDNKQPVTDRYLHAGRVSHGCATIGRTRSAANPLTPDEVGARWKPLCEYLLNCRLDGGNSHVGVLHVVDRPPSG